jgi:hypothetical protein
MPNPTYDATKEDFRGLTNVSGPARFAAAIVPSDTVGLAIGPGAGGYAKALYVGGAGDLVVITVADATNNGLGTAVTFKAVPVGWFPVQVRAVMATGTTATNIVGVAD